MLTFGRFTDSYKSKEKLEAWTNAEKLFGEKNYKDSYIEFINYITDDNVKNVTHTNDENGITFELVQGSKIVRGSANNRIVTAESRIAEFDKLSVALMRRLLEMNYSMYYSRFAVNGNYITIKFDSSIIDGSPRKLYYALKELALRADKQDDLLFDDFSTLKPLDNSIIEISPEGKEIKYNYFLKWINESVEKISAMNEQQMSGGISYLLLKTLYKVDYLLSPQGTVMHEIEKISFEYFKNDNKNLEEKNRGLKVALIKLKDMEKEKVLEDFYSVRSTFGIVNPAPHQAVIDAIDNNIKNVKWYADHSYVEIAEGIFEYIAAYSLFSFGLPKPTIKLLDIIMNILNQDYYVESGRADIYYDKTLHQVNADLIKKKIEEIIEEGKADYPELKVNIVDLKFDTKLAFLKSFVKAIQELDYTNI